MDINSEISKVIKIALAEDVGEGDVTCAATIPADAVDEFTFNAREEIIFCGEEVIRQALPFARIMVKDGEALKAGQAIATAKGNVREVLTKERTVLNLIQHLSAISTETAKYVEEVKGTKAKILDTRKTTPGLRVLEKYAVKCGGGENHRMGLYDMVMIKDNHIKAGGSIAEAVANARRINKVQNNYSHLVTGVGGYKDKKPQELRIEVECDTLEQVKQAIEAKADIIMLDNMGIMEMIKAVELIEGKALVEASGNVNLQTVRKIAETGVDYISTSKITVGARPVDIGLD